MTAGSKRYRVEFTAKEQAELTVHDVEDVPLAPDEVVGPTVVSLISAGTELATYSLQDKFPRQPGYAAIMRVEAVGEDVADLRPGDLAFTPGRHASYQRARRPDALPVPRGLPPEVAVFTRMMGVSMSTLTTTTARPPAKVIVTGLGPVGHMAAQVFAGCGYEVTAVDPIEARRRMAGDKGIGHVLPAVPVEDDEYVGQVALVVECSGHEQAVLDACRVVQRRGEVVLVGLPWQRKTDLSAHDILHAVFHRYVVLRSGWEWELPHYPADFRTNSIRGNWAAGMEWLSQGRVRVDGLYDRAAPRDAQQVYQDLLQRRRATLVTLFDWADCP